MVEKQREDGRKAERRLVFFKSYLRQTDSVAGSSGCAVTLIQREPCYAPPWCSAVCMNTATGEFLGLHLGSVFLGRRRTNSSPPTQTPTQTHRHTDTHTHTHTAPLLNHRVEEGALHKYQCAFAFLTGQTLLHSHPIPTPAGFLKTHPPAILAETKKRNLR